MSILAHVTPQIAPGFLFAFLAGLVGGAVLAYGFWLRRAR